MIHFGLIQEEIMMLMILKIILVIIISILLVVIIIEDKYMDLMLKHQVENIILLDMILQFIIVL